MSQLNVLLIDNHRSRQQSLSLLLEFMSYAVTNCNQIGDIPDNNYDLVFLGDRYAEQYLPLLSNLNQQLPQTPFILIKNQNEIPFDSIKQQFPLLLGVFSEPFKQNTLMELIAELVDEQDNDFSKHSLPDSKDDIDEINQSGSQIDVDLNIAFDSYLEKNLIGQSQAMLKVKKLIQQVAKSTANVLILGESGTGKEVVASCIHQLSKRSDFAYVPVNCGAIPGDLLESELFGHEKGAFTGAISARQGRFELAQGGTLFLDEIGDMPLAMQVKLLRVLQEKIFERVGGIKSIKSDVRVLAATHRNLEEQVENGKFREDLFYRLNVFPIEIPALRERVSDIPLLIDIFNRQIEAERDERISLSDEAMASLFCHHWPGNVRELGNLVERLAIIFADEIIAYDDLPEKYQYDISDFDYAQLKISQPATISHENVLSSDDNTVKDSTDRDHAETASTALDEEDAIQPVNAVTEKFALPDEDFDLKAHLSQLEQSLIQDALNKANGVVAHAAKRLSIRRTTLVEKMKKFGITGK